MGKRYFLLGLFLLFLAIYLFSFFFFSSPHYKVKTSIRRNLFLLQAVAKEGKRGRKDIFGICPPPGCGPSQEEEREEIELFLTDEQITSFLNQYKPSFILLRDIRVKFSDGLIFASAISFYPFLPGHLSCSGRLAINRFYLQDFYVGENKAPEKLFHFVQVNGNKMFDSIFAKYGVWLRKMELRGEKLYFQGNVPQGMVEVKKDGIIILRLISDSSKPIQTRCSKLANIRCWSF